MEEEAITTKKPDDDDAEFERMSGPEPLERGEHEGYVDAVRASMNTAMDHAFDPESEMRCREDERAAGVSASVEQQLDPALECPQKEAGIPGLLFLSYHGPGSLRGVRGTLPTTRV